MKIIFLSNLGSPQKPSAPSVRRYLNQFLSDPRVIDLPALLRLPLVYGFISPLRAPKSAQAYQKIWTSKGSPLIRITQRLADEIQKTLDPGRKEILVVPCMRYGEPSFESEWKKYRHLAPEKIVFAPLYPHYASSSSGSAIEDCFRVLSADSFIPPLEILPPFHSEPAFIESQALRFRECVSETVDHVLMSFHGLPERHIRTADPSSRVCQLNSECCAQTPPHCYRSQCFATARLLARELGIPSERYTICFQSRLGRDPWLQPPTDQVIPGLAKKGIRSLAVVCPSFVADCLETLEEISIRGRHDFLQAGGERFYAVPCINDSGAWVKGFANMLRLRL